MVGRDGELVIGGVVRDEAAGTPRSGLVVRAFDARHVSEIDSLGEGQTDADGRFVIRYRGSDLVRRMLEGSPKGGPDVVLQVSDQAGTTLLTTPIYSGASRFEHHDILVPGASVPTIGLDAILDAANIADKRAVSERLRERRMEDSGDLLSAVSGLKAVDVGLDEGSLQRVLWVAKLHAASGSISLAGKVAAQDEARTLTELAAVPEVRLEKTLGELSDQERIALRKLRGVAASVRRDVVNHAAAQQRRKSRDREWHPGQEVLDRLDLDKKWPRCKDCDPWRNVFSPLAYLFDLLDLIYSHWGVPTSTLKKLLFQEIDELGEEEAQATVPQVELAVEVLEKYVKATGVGIPIDDPQLARACLAEWRGLLDDTTEDRLRSASGARVEELADRILATSSDLASIRRIRELLTWTSETGSDPSIAMLSASYEQGGTAFAESLAATYARVLVAYRDALIAHSHEHSARRLQEKLFLDLQAQPCALTNRLTQLILSLQSFILAIRTGDIADVSRSDLTSDVIDLHGLSAFPVEDADWRWLQDFQTWSSAMYTLLYPENVLLPPLFGDRYSEAFVEAQQALVTARVDRDAACRAYAEYLFDWSMPGALKGLLESGSEETQAGGQEPVEDAREQLELKIGKQRARFVGQMTVRGAHSLKAMIEYGKGELWDLDWWRGRFAELDQRCAECVHGGAEPVPGAAQRAYCAPWERDRSKAYEEPDLQFPLLAAWSLGRSGEYPPAHDWYRLLYDPMRPRGQRHKFPFREHFNDTAVRSENWWDDVLDPQHIALRREGVYLRHVVLATVRNLLDWGDHEYALARPETIDRARELYELAGRVLQAPDLADRCGRAIRELELDIVTGIRPELRPFVPGLVGEIDRLRGVFDPDILDDLMTDLKRLLPTVHGPRDIDLIRSRVSEALRMDRAGRSRTTLGHQHAAARAALAACEGEVLFAGERGSAATMVAGRTGVDCSRYFSAVLSGSGPLREQWDRFGGGPIRTSVTFCVPANPLLRALNFYIELSLFKIRHCLSIAGEPLPANALPTTASEVLDTLTGEIAHSTLQATMNVAWGPPRYRYSYLVDRARQYADVAQRLGSTLLMAYEKREEERLRQLQARQGVDLMRSTVTLKDLAVTEASTSLKVAKAQKDRAQTQFSFWKGRLDENRDGLSDWETLGLELMIGSAVLEFAAALVGGGAGIAAFFAGGEVGAAAGGSAGAVAGGAPAPAGAAVGATAGFSVGAAIAAALPGTAGAVSSLAQAVGTTGSWVLTVASFQRRWEEWNLQLDLSKWDLKIGDLQINQATDRTHIACQDREIAKLQQAHAEETLRFLETKFSNDKLYVWMIDVLGQGYRSVMQLAAAAAHQAQNALEFERQEAVEIIAGDYWSAGATGVPTSGLSEEQSQSGLLGAERLLTDLTKLDAYELATERRQLQVSKTISMAQTMAGELVRLCTEGRVTFNTLMDWFDLDFPGHYLRLIKSVRVSILCLASPVDGIHAMLHNDGLSSVVVRDSSGAFTRRRTMRAFPESIALDAAYNESGLFVLDYNDPLYLPFEGLGVETQWTLELPRATNRFDFNTIVDVMLTIDYTAFHDAAYAAEVRERYRGPVTADVMVDLRAQYSDAWYHFKNPEAGTEVMARSIAVTLEASALPPNLRKCDGAGSMRVYHVTLLAVGDAAGFPDDADFSAIAVAKNDVALTVASHTVLRGRRVVLLSTRAPDVAPDEDLGISANLAPDGSWSITISDAALAEQITALLLVVTVEGCLDWPD